MAEQDESPLDHATRIVEECMRRHQGATALDDTLLYVGARLGIPWEYGESAEAYRDRLIATGEVVDIQPGHVTLAPKLKSITCEIGFISPDEGE